MHYSITPKTSLPAHIPQEVAKETLQQAPQLDSVSKTPKAFNKTENLTGEDIEYTPVLAKNTRIANPKQVVMHNNIYKVNLGMLGELENNLFFSLFNRLKDKKDTVIRFTPQELKALAGDPHMPNTRLYKVTLDLFNNIAEANFD
ncbi:RepB family plasmid replication initiator protein [Helicobacter ailurogastricus]|uniref:RepB family plasmid replication initiator protein n=1 Tax=Helicobacter ailurogastricus TaxID=1578720 RepID=UPI000CF13DC5|nr:RepB family plasmid replication initiator protein [Helicobacter ailurogastricus]